MKGEKLSAQVMFHDVFPLFLFFLFFFFPRENLNGDNITDITRLGLTSRSIAELDDIEAAATDGTTVGSFDPGLQTVIVQDMATREQPGDFARTIITINHVEVDYGVR